MKKIFTILAAALFSVSMMAETVDDLKVISKDYNVYFEDVVTSNVTAGTLITDYVLSQVANTYKTNQGTDKTVSKLYCLRVKGTSQDVLAFKVSSSCTLVLYANRATDRTPYLDTKVAAQGESSITGTPTATDGAKGYVTYSIPAAGTYYIIGNGSDCYLAGLEFSGFCTDPEFTVPEGGNGFVGDPIALAITSKNNSKPVKYAVTVDGVEGVSGTDYSFSVSLGVVQATPLKAGTFEITFSQASDGTYCAAEESATFVISEKTPVTAVTIDGPAAGFVGQELTYTATAEGATAYQWLVDGIDANTNAATFVYTAAKGNHSIVCKARNQFNVQNEEETWVESAPIALTVSNVSGTLVSFIVNSDANGAANLSGVLAADANAKVSLTKGSSQVLDEYTGYKMDKGKYVGVTLNKGSFAEGDTVSFMVTKASGTAKLYLYDDEKGTNRLDSIAFSGQTGWATFVLNQATTGVYLFRSNPDVKPYDQNPYIAALNVIRPKAVDHADVTLVGATIDGEALPSDFVTHLINEGTFTIFTSYVNAPVVAFVKHTDTYYEGETEPVSTNDSIKVTATEVEGEWQAQATIGENTYTIKMKKAASFSVVYMFGEKKLGEELVAANGNPAEYETYQAIKLAAFKGWYSDKALETPVADMSAEVISTDKIYYAKFEYKYSQSVNISKWILENGAGKGATDKSTALINLLGSNYYTSNFAWENGNLELDSLNDEKTDRNEPYLGLKVKKAGAMFRLRLAPGSFVNIKIGAYKGILQVAINDGEFKDATLTDGVYHYEATGEDLVSFKMKDANAVVLQQLMINEAIQEVLLPGTITCSGTENGSLAADKKVAYKGEEVKLTVTPNAGYQIASVTVNGEPLAADGEGNYVFEMPNEKVTVAATFSISTALDNTEAEAKAVKVVRDGQLLILKNGVLYNAQGAIVK